MAKEKAPLTEVQKKKKVDRQRQRREERKQELISLGVKNPSRYYNSEKAFKEIVTQRKAEIKRQKKYQKEKERQSKNIETLKEKGVHETWFNSLKRKSKNFIGLIDKDKNPHADYFEEKPKKVKKQEVKQVPQDIHNIFPDTILLTWKEITHDVQMKDVINMYSNLTVKNLYLTIQDNYNMLSDDSNFSGGEITFGIYDPHDYTGYLQFNLMNGASTESLQEFNLKQLLVMIATATKLSRQSQAGELMDWVNKIRKRYVPKEWQEFIPELAELDIKFKPRKAKKRTRKRKSKK